MAKPGSATGIFKLTFVVCLLCTPVGAQAEVQTGIQAKTCAEVKTGTTACQGLFHIARNKNANIIQYDAHVDPDGKLSKKKPVVAYWVRMAEQGQVQELSWIQRTFAYGFKAKLGDSRENAELTMKIDLGEPIRIIREGDVYRATAPIEGAPSYLEKIFIQTNSGRMAVKIEYLELFGADIRTGEARYQKIYP